MSEGLRRCRARTHLRCGVGAVLVAATLSACGGATGRVQTAPESASAPVRVDQQMLGQWELVSLEVQRDGQAVRRSAHGELSYDEFANLSVRVELSPQDPSVSPPRVVLLDFIAKASPDRARGELAYVGLQPRSPADRLVPDAVDASEWRHFDLQGEVLRLSVVENGRTVATLTWRRAGQ